MRKNFLTLAMIFLVSIGFLAASVSLFKFLSPNDISLNNVPYIDIASMSVGEVKELHGSYLHIFVTKLEGKNKYRLVAVYHRNGRYQLPEFDWRRPVLPCVNFGLTPDKTYKCLDSGDFWWRYMEWDQEGKYIGKVNWGESVANLIRPKHRLENGILFLFES